MYYEHWRPAGKLMRARSKTVFLTCIDDDFHRDPLPNTEQAVMAVFELLNKKITAGEIEHVRHALPNDLRTLWAAKYSAPGALRQ